MKTLLRFCICIFALGWATQTYAQTGGSTGGSASSTYRLPIASGQTFTVLADAYSNSNRNQIILGSANTANQLTVTAAKAGRIEMMDLWVLHCNDSLPGPLDPDCPKYMVINHFNGEVTWYENLDGASVTALGLNVGDWVAEGQALGMGHLDSISMQRIVSFHAMMPTNGTNDYYCCPNDSYPPYPKAPVTYTDRAGKTYSIDAQDQTPIFCLGTYSGQVWAGQTLTTASCMPSRKMAEADLATTSVNAFPNPAQAQLNFQITLEQPEQLTLSLIDIQGRTHRTLLTNQMMEAGMHDLSTDVSDLAAGIWFYQLTSPTRTETGKIVILD